MVVGISQSAVGLVWANFLPISHVNPGQPSSGNHVVAARATSACVYQPRTNSLGVLELTGFRHTTIRYDMGLLSTTIW